MSDLCSHKDRKVTVKAKELVIACARCKEAVHTRRRVLSSSIYALDRIELRRWSKNKIKKIDFEVQYIGKAGGYGKVYVYYNVPEEHYYKALRAKSIGSYIAENIKGKFDFAEVK